MSEVSTIVDGIRSDVSALNAAVAANKTELANTVAASIKTQQDRLDAIETALSRSAAADARGEQKEISKHRKAFKSYAQTGNEMELRTVQGLVGTSADGGYAVPVEIDTNVTSLLVEMSDLRPHAKIVTISTDKYLHNISQSNAAGGWVGETDARDKTDAPTIGRVTITPGELYANPETSLQLIEDGSFDVESWYATETATTLAVLEGTAFVAGDGTNKPKGFLTYTQNSLGTSLSLTGTADYTKLNTITSESAQLITVADVMALIYSQKPAARKAGKFFCSRTILQKIASLKDSTGRLLWLPSLVVGQPDTLAGYPIVEIADMPASLVGTGSPLSTPLALAFGDLKRAYTIVDRVGLTTLRDPYTNKGFVSFYTRKRVGGGLEDGTALSVLKVKQS